MKIYVASSWRNQYQDIVVATLRAARHEVYDFKHPIGGDNGFSWREVDPTWGDWNTARYRLGLQHPAAKAGFECDFNAMRWAEACVLVLPCGRSAHLEAGWFTGAGKPLIVYVPVTEKIEPELMYLLGGDCVRDSLHDVLHCLEAASGVPLSTLIGPAWILAKSSMITLS